MNIFNLPIDEFKKEVDKILHIISTEDLYQELIKCGLDTQEKEEE